MSEKSSCPWEISCWETRIAARNAQTHCDQQSFSVGKEGTLLFPNRKELQVGFRVFWHQVWLFCLSFWNQHLTADLYSHQEFVLIHMSRHLSCTDNGKSQHLCWYRTEFDSSLLVLNHRVTGNEAETKQPVFVNMSQALLAQEFSIPTAVQWEHGMGIFDNLCPVKIGKSLSMLSTDYSG